METLTVEEAHTKIETFAKNAHVTEMRTVAHMTPGQWIRQGDVMLVRLDHIPGAYSDETQNRQLAPGESRGSRHILAEGPCIYVNPTNRDPLLGPVIVSKETFVLTHPEHAHFTLPAGTYQARFQQEYSEEERRRAQD